MVKNLRFHLSRLWRFSGRETSAQFWPWAAIVMGLNIAVAAFVMVPIMFESIAKMDRFVREHPDQGTITTGPGSYSIQVHGYHPELMPDVGSFMLSVQVSVLVSVLLLAAAVARRLHDTGRSGFLGLLPLPFLTIGLTLFPGLLNKAMVQGNPDLDGFAMLFANNMLYLALVGLLAYLLARKSSNGDNRFGPPAGS